MASSNRAGIFDVVLDNARQLGAERADLGVELGPHELTEIVDDFERSFSLTAPISMISTFRGFRLRQHVASKS